MDSYHNFNHKNVSCIEACMPFAHVYIYECMLDNNSAYYEGLCGPFTTFHSEIRGHISNILTLLEETSAGQMFAGSKVPALLKSTVLLLLPSYNDLQFFFVAANFKSH